MEKLQIEASPDAADLILKAVEHVVAKDFPESGDGFAQQNEASKHMIDEFDRAFDTMAENLLKQVGDVLKEADQSQAQ